MVSQGTVRLLGQDEKASSLAKEGMKVMVKRKLGREGTQRLRGLLSCFVVAARRQERGEREQRGEGGEGKRVRKQDAARRTTEKG